MMDKMGHKEGEVIQHSMITKSIERAQKKVEENNFGIRKRLLEYDDVMNKQRDVIYKRRRNALSGERLALDVANMIYEVSESIVNYSKSSGDFKEFEFEIIKNFTMESPVSEEEFRKSSNPDLIQKVYEHATADYKIKQQTLAEQLFPVIQNVFINQGDRFKNILIPITDGIKELGVVADLKLAYESKGQTLSKEIEKGITLAIIDENWKEHLREMDELRKSVQNATYEQKDPLVIYKQESFNLFAQMIDKINKEVVSFLYKGELKANENEAQLQQVPVQKKKKSMKVEV
jgi:preprotein translocase subunit SecA